MSTTKEELHTLVEQLSAEKAERVLKLLTCTVDHTHTIDEPEPDEPDSGREHIEVMRRHLRQVGERIGLDVDRLPQNGYCSGGESEGGVELTKDWESEDARHRLSKLNVQGHEIVLLERMTAGAGSELLYEVRVLTEQSERRAELRIPVR
jgi:hypothetical protein